MAYPNVFPQVSTSIVQGTTTNDNAAAGILGEHASSGVVPTTVSLTTATPVDLHSVSLAAGDYDIQGIGTFQTAATTSVSQVIAGISTTSATLGADGTYARSTFTAFVPGAIEHTDQVTPVTRLSLAATTTVYLVGQSTFSISTQTAGGVIRWRRVR
jgi:hypothetical protein